MFRRAVSERGFELDELKLEARRLSVEALQPEKKVMEPEEGRRLC